MYEDTIDLNQEQYSKLTVNNEDLYKEAYELKLQFPEDYLVERLVKRQGYSGEYRLTFKTKQECDNFYKFFQETSLSLA